MKYEKELLRKAFVAGQDHEYARHFYSIEKSERSEFEKWYAVNVLSWRKKNVGILAEHSVALLSLTDECMSSSLVRTYINEQKLKY